MAPTLRIRRAVKADKDRLMQVHYDAFAPTVLSRTLYPDGPTPEAEARYMRALEFLDADKAENKKAAGDQAGGGSEEEKEVVPAVEPILMVAELVPSPDDHGGEGGDEGPVIVASAKWNLHRRHRTEEEWNVEPAPAPATTGSGVAADSLDEALDGLHRMRRRWMKGDPALHLAVLVCSTKYQRTGAGSALMRWGVELGDSLGLPMWLEASAAGYSLYRRFGFEPVDVHDLPLTEKWGPVRDEGENWGQDNAVEVCGPLGEGCYRNTMMRRPAVGETAGSAAVAAPAA